VRAEVVRAEVGSWKLEVGSWKLEVGSWKSEVGSWKLEVGSWKLESRSPDLPPTAALPRYRFSFLPQKNKE